MDPARDLDLPVALGTTIMAASFDGGVILGADSRTSTGSYVANRVTDKLTALTDKIYMCRSGSAADTQNVTAYLRWMLAQHQMETSSDPEVRTAANLAQQIVYPNKNFLSAGLIVAGWDQYSGGTVYALPLGGTMVKTPFSIGGSGSAYIYGFCDKNWRDGMTEAQCRDFVTRAVSLAMGRDGSSGGCIRLAIIDKAGVRREFVPNNKVLLFEESSGEIAPPMAA